MGAFFDWLLSNLNWMIPVIFILAFALPILSVIRRLTKGHVSKSSCTVQTVGFIRSTQQTGMYVNENPQLLFELDALAAVSYTHLADEGNSGKAAAYRPVDR